VKVFGCRPNDDGATYSGGPASENLQERKPREMDCAVPRALWDLIAADDERDRWEDGPGVGRKGVRIITVRYHVDRGAYRASGLVLWHFETYTNFRCVGALTV
jgi:hypothetical protein